MTNGFAHPPIAPRDSRMVSALPAPANVTVARVFLGIHAGLWSLTLPGAFRGVASSRPFALASLTMVALLVTLPIRLGRARPWAWTGAVLVQLLLVVLYAWLTYLMVTPNGPGEGMAAFFWMIIGPVFIAISLAGLIPLLGPRTMAYCRRRH